MNVFVLDWVYSIRIDGDWDLRKYDKFDIENVISFFSLFFSNLNGCDMTVKCIMQIYSLFSPYI